MKNVAQLILFFSYTITIFLIQNHIVIGIFAIINILLMVLVKVNVRKAIRNMLAIGILAIIVVATNAFISGIEEGIWIGVKLLLVCNITYTFSKILTPTKLIQAIEILLIPFKIVKINPREIGLILTIAISFLPIILHTFEETIFAIKAKGEKVNLTNGKLLLKPILISILKRVNEIDLALKVKGYEG